LDTTLLRTSRPIGIKEERVSNLYYLEDLEVDQTITSLGRTVTQADLTAFSGLSGDFHPLHVDEQWARENTPFGGRIAPGMLVTSISYALRADVVDSLSQIGWMEAQRRFLKPVFPDDTVHAVWTVKELRPSRSRPEAGVVTLDIQVLNQSDEVVQDGYDVLLVHRREQQ
jgi:3-hydroxybutyryl-CoA dehydratase